MNDAKQFLATFNPMRTNFGTLKLTGETDERGKKTRKQLTANRPLTAVDVESHLSLTNRTIGFYPHCNNEHVGFGVIDVDTYNDSKLCPGLARKCAGTAFVVARSPSGAAHIYHFPDAPVKGKEMRAYLKRQAVETFGLDDDVEVFPKQDKLTKESPLGNYINAPLAGILSDAKSRLDRCVFDDDGNRITSFDPSIKFIESKRAPLPKFNGEEKPQRYGAAVDDLAKIEPGNRSDSLISHGSTMCAAGLDFETVIKPAIEAIFWQSRGTVTEPAKKELECILKNLRKKSGGEDSRFTNLVRVVPARQTATSDVYFRFEYGGQSVTLHGFTAFKNHNKIIDAVAEQIGRIPDMNRATWATIRDQLWQDKRDEKDHDSTESSIEFALWSHIDYSMRTGAYGLPPWNGARLAAGEPYCYVDLDDGRMYYYPTPMISRINASGLGIKVTTHQLRSIIRAMQGGAESCRPKVFASLKDSTGKPIQKLTGAAKADYFHWIPCPEETLAELQRDFDEGQGHSTASIKGWREMGQHLDVKRIAAKPVADDDSWEVRQKEGERKLKNRSAY